MNELWQFILSVYTYLKDFKDSYSDSAVQARSAGGEILELVVSLLLEILNKRKIILNEFILQGPLELAVLKPNNISCL